MTNEMKLSRAFSHRNRIHNAAHQVLHNPDTSKAAKTANGSALSQRRDRYPWQSKRKGPYTEIGVRRLKCIRCGEPAEVQWQICSDGNNYRPICKTCDIKLNKLVLSFMKHPHAKQLAAEYESEKDNG